MHRVLIIAPEMGLEVHDEVYQAASGFAPRILHGTVTRAQALDQIASGKYDVIHFATHGQEHVLRLSDGVLEEEMLEHAVRRAASVKLIFLNACRSAHTAVEVYNHSDVSFSIGWPVDVADDAALAWARLFYEALQIDPADVRRAADVANDSLTRSHRIDPNQLPLVLNGRALALLEENRRLRAQLDQQGVVRMPLWALLAIAAANAVLVLFLLANLVILSLTH